MNNAINFAARKTLSCTVGSDVNDNLYLSSRQISSLSLLNLNDYIYISYLTGEIRTWDVNYTEKLLCCLCDFQNPNGFFVGKDPQRHNQIHTTAYSLGSILLLASSNIELDKIKHMVTLINHTCLDPNFEYKSKTAELMDNLHIWRGSHNLAGMAAIVGQISVLKELVLSNKELASESSSSAMPSLNEWSDLVVEKHASSKKLFARKDRMLRLLGAFFDVLFQVRHDKLVSEVGALAHYLWVFDKIGCVYPIDSVKMKRLTQHQDVIGSYENGGPYCLDYDFACVATHYLNAAGHEMSKRERIRVESMLKKNRDYILKYLNKKDLTLHALVGALSAVARINNFTVKDQETGVLRDPLDVAWWL